MATHEQLPGKLNVAFNKADEYAALLDLSIATTGYLWTAEICSLVDGAVILSPTVTDYDASLGKINVAITEAQAASLAVGSYALKITGVAPGSVQRRFVEGICEVVK